MTHLRPDYAMASAAAERIAKFMSRSPLHRHAEFSTKFSADVHIKKEFLNPVGSFKLRGALNVVQVLQESTHKKTIVTCSTGNHGSAMAFACREFNVPIEVGVPEDCDRRKAELIRQFGANLKFVGRDLDETKEILQSELDEEQQIFVEDGSSPDVVAGTATIGLELQEQLPSMDVVVVPVGNGALIGGVGAMIKERMPAAKVIGVYAEKAPCMALSFDAGKPIDTESCDTFAGGVAVRVAIPAAVQLVNEVVDEMLPVSDENMKAAMAEFYRHSGELPEGAGAASLAALSRYPAKFAGRTICLVASGANVDDKLRMEVLGNAG
jgi:threonine dehydratase